MYDKKEKILVTVYKLVYINEALMSRMKVFQSLVKDPIPNFFWSS